MSKGSFYCAGSSPGIQHAKQLLIEQGILFTDSIRQDTRYVLMDVPSFQGNGIFRGVIPPDKLVTVLSSDTVLIGGNLSYPEFDSFQKIDLLQDECYLCSNAAITADCTLQVILPLLKTTLAQTPTLVIGWGRIGKCLAQCLKALGTPVTVAVRKPEQAAILEALGYRAVFSKDISRQSHMFRLMINTVPHPILTQGQLSRFEDCVLVDLASNRGLPGDNVLWARGLPGIYAPESSGRLISETVIRYLREESE